MDASYAMVLISNLCAPVLTTPNNSVTANSSANFANSGGGNNGNGNNSSRRSPVRTAASRLSEAPRTPTPFKKALADVYQRREPLSRTVSCSDVAIWDVAQEMEGN